MPETIRLFNRKVEASTRLPASRFPEYAERYVCDVCGLDVASKIQRSSGHGGPSIGPERFSCICGARYLSGMVEWDHLHPFMRRQYLKGLLVAPALLILPAALFVYLAGTAIHRHSILFGVLACVEGLIAIPFELFGIVAMFSLPSIAMSIWRTRISKPGTSA
jgi:hypothetical protein